MHQSRVKTVSCLLRQPEKFNLSLNAALPRNENPRAGDVVFVRCMSSDGCVTQVENQDGLLVRLYKEDILVAVLADRKTGYHISGHVPKEPIARGDVLGLIYRDCIAAIPTCIPPYVGHDVMKLEVVGFARGRGKAVANLSDAAPIDPAKCAVTTPQPGHLLFLIGTSSECGKTTFTTNFNLAIKRQYPGVRTAGIKACGTGSNRDKQAMLDASYDCAIDFVDCGLATTYEISPHRYASALNAMLAFCQARSDLVVTEIGGDFLEGNAPEALRILSNLNAACVLQVSDAMGALEGLRRLRSLGVKPLAIGCFRQNLESLNARIEAEGYSDILVLDNRDVGAMDGLAAKYIRSALADDPTAQTVNRVAGAPWIVEWGAWGLWGA
jgi:hypothetical protein